MTDATIARRKFFRFLPLVPLAAVGVVTFEKPAAVKPANYRNRNWPDVEIEVAPGVWAPAWSRK